MDRGEIFKEEFKVLPGANGSFVISTRGAEVVGRVGRQYGFTNIADLVRFLTDEAEARASAILGDENAKSCGGC